MQALSKVYTRQMPRLVGPAGKHTSKTRSVTASKPNPLPGSVAQRTAAAPKRRSTSAFFELLGAVRASSLVVLLLRQ